MKNTITTIIGLVLLASSYGSIYRGDPVDIIILEGEAHRFEASPLEEYLKYICDLNLVTEFDRTFLTPHYSHEIQRFWEIRDDKLFLTKIKTRRFEEEYPLNKIFPKAEGPVFADWFSGKIRYSFGDMFIFGETSFLEQEMVIHILNGKVTKQFTINHSKRSALYARKFLEQQYPLAEDRRPKLYTGTDNRKRKITEYMQEAFSNCEMENGRTSYDLLYSIRIKISADIDHFRYKKGQYEDLSCYQLLNVIAQETETILDVSITDFTVTYEIKESEPEH